MPNDPNPATIDPHSKLLDRAIQLAVRSHAGQADKSGLPYILHPLRVMDSLRGNTLDMVVAVLHDVIEDTEITAEYLRDTFGLCQELVDDIVMVSWR